MAKKELSRLLRAERAGRLSASDRDLIALARAIATLHRESDALLVQAARVCERIKHFHACMKRSAQHPVTGGR
jgi:hypothetical protein